MHINLKFLMIGLKLLYSNITKYVNFNLYKFFIILRYNLPDKYILTRYILSFVISNRSTFSFFFYFLFAILLYRYQCVELYKHKF